MASLPPETLVEVFGFQSGEDLPRLALVCARWHKIIQLHKRQLPVAKWPMPLKWWLCANQPSYLRIWLPFLAALPHLLNFGCWTMLALGMALFCPGLLLAEAALLLLGIRLASWRPVRHFHTGPWKRLMLLDRLHLICSALPALFVLIPVDSVFVLSANLALHLAILLFASIPFNNV